MEKTETVEFPVYTATLKKTHPTLPVLLCLKMHLMNRVN